MKIISTDYAFNKTMTYAALARHFSELAGLEHVASEPISPYNAQADKISLEAEIDKVVVGRLIGSYDLNTNSIRIDALFIDSERRGHGIGARLMHAFEQDAISKKVTASFVDTVKSSAPAFYERLGYRRIGEIEDYPETGETYYLYMKNLKAS